MLALHIKLEEVLRAITTSENVIVFEKLCFQNVFRRRPSGLKSVFEKLRDAKETFFSELTEK